MRSDAAATRRVSKSALSVEGGWGWKRREREREKVRDGAVERVEEKNRIRQNRINAAGRAQSVGKESQTPNAQTAASAGKQVPPSAWRTLNAVEALVLLANFVAHGLRLSSELAEHAVHVAQVLVHLSLTVVARDGLDKAAALAPGAAPVGACVELA